MPRKYSDPSRKLAQRYPDAKLPEAIVGTDVPKSLTLFQRTFRHSKVTKKLARVKSSVTGFTPGDGYRADEKRAKDYKTFENDILKGKCYVSEMRDFVKLYGSKTLDDPQVIDILNKHCRKETYYIDARGRTSGMAPI